jgi:hypothetical protein
MMSRIVSLLVCVLAGHLLAVDAGPGWLDGLIIGMLALGVHGLVQADIEPWIRRHKTHEDER